MACFKPIGFTFAALSETLISFDETCIFIAGRLYNVHFSKCTSKG